MKMKKKEESNQQRFQMQKYRELNKKIERSKRKLYKAFDIRVLDPSGSFSAHNVFLLLLFFWNSSRLILHRFFSPRFALHSLASSRPLFARLTCSHLASPRLALPRLASHRCASPHLVLLHFISPALTLPRSASAHSFSNRLASLRLVLPCLPLVTLTASDLRSLCTVHRLVAWVLRGTEKNPGYVRMYTDPHKKVQAETCRQQALVKRACHQQNQAKTSNTMSKYVGIN